MPCGTKTVELVDQWSTEDLNIILPIVQSETNISFYVNSLKLIQGSLSS